MLVISAAATSFAQSTADGQRGRFHLGALTFTPSIVVSDVGRDSNVFNSSVAPQSDTTAALGPAVQLWLRAGHARITGESTNRYLYYSQFESQRSWNSANQARVEFPLARMTPYAGGAYTNARDRAGYEIDGRVHYVDQSAYAGTRVRISGKSELGFRVRRQDYSYDRDETFLGATLADTLDRVSTSEQVEGRYSLTPLTTFVVRAETVQDRFDVDEGRDANSIAVMPGFEFKPFALISGSVAAGYRHFDVLSGEAPGYNGIIANIDAHYQLPRTKFDVRFGRDVTYSYAVLTPYYVLSDLGVMVTQKVTRNWELLARGGRQWLNYVAIDVPIDPGTVFDDSLVGRTDKSLMAGGGIAYRLTPLFKIGFDANYYRRDSQLEFTRGYDGLRVGASFSYGTPQ